MRQIDVAVAVLNQTPLDWDANQRRIVAAIEAARREHARVLCLPEMCITGYGCEDAFSSMNVLAQAERVLGELAPASRGMAIAVGLPVLHRKGVYNAVALLVDGTLAGLVAKRFLAGDGIHYEPRWFKPWPTGARATTQLCGREVPIGDLLFDLGGVRIGFEICEDAWVADRPGAALARAGVDLILNPSASHFAFGKLEVRKRFVIEGSRAFGVTYLYANLLGNEAGRAIYDGGGLIASGGRIVAAGPRLGFRESYVTTATVDIELARMSQARAASFRPDTVDAPGSVVEIDFKWPASAAARVANTPETWENSADLKQEEFTRAEALGLFDYLRKSSLDGFVVSLSGGADSSAVATLVALAVRRACAELTVAGVIERLNAPAPLAGARTCEELVARLLTTVFQPSMHSSRTSREAAAAVARALGATHLELAIDDLVAGYVDQVQAALGRELTWKTDDVALQNVQARARAPGVWLIANLRNALLLATSNRSEAAVGYATMDGDTCGGLSPIAGIDKAFLRLWLEWMVTSGPSGLGPIRELAIVTARRSTPELRPADACQASEDDLMPFPILDEIERCAIRDKRSPAEVLALLAAAHPEHGALQLKVWVERFFHLWCRNQWKRERYAPSFHLDDENLDPKTWCRFPILSGGFARELGEL